MVFGKDFVWLHLGKTGGTTTEHLFSHFCSDIVYHSDKFKDIRKHQTLDEIKQRFPKENFDEKEKIIGIRNILDWIISHNCDRLRGHSGLTNKKECIEKSKAGFAYTENGWVKPDYFAKKYFTDINHFIRVEFLEQDFQTVIQKYKPYLKIPNNKFLNRNPIKLNITYSQEEIEKIYSQNPIWISTQERLYEN